MTVPPSSERRGCSSAWIRPFIWCFNIVSTKVVLALLNSLACTIICGTLWGWLAKNPLVKLGAPVFSVLLYSKPKASNAFDTLSAAHNSTAIPDCFLISSSNFFSRCSKSTLIRSAFSKSTRTPRCRIGIIVFNTFNSRSKISPISSFMISPLKCVHKRKVNAASCSA